MLIKCKRPTAAALALLLAACSGSAPQPDQPATQTVADQALAAFYGRTETRLGALEATSAATLARFADYDARLAALVDRLAAVEARHAPVYCGSTDDTDGEFKDGPLIGYAAADSLCDRACAGSHMCSFDEVRRSGRVPEANWIATSAQGCNGFAGGGVNGTIYGGDPPRPLPERCTADPSAPGILAPSHPIACCR